MSALTGTIAEIRMFAGTRVPEDWALCEGQLLPVANYQALYSLIGNYYGGNQVAFALPDLRGRSPIGAGTGAGLGQVMLGETLGRSEITLTTNQMPPHVHYPQGQSATGNQQSPANGVCADEGYEGLFLYSDTPNAVMGATSLAGNGQSFNNYQQSLGINFIICLTGIYPVRQ